MLGLWLPRLAAPSSSSRRSPGLADSQPTSAEAGPGLSSAPPPNPACSKGCLPPTGRSPEWPGLERVKNCSEAEAGEADFSPPAFAGGAVVLCRSRRSPLPNICPSCPSRRNGTEHRTGQGRTAAASGPPGVLSSTQSRSAPPVRRIFASWVHCARTWHLQIGDTETNEEPRHLPSVLPKGWPVSVWSLLELHGRASRATAPFTQPLGLPAAVLCQRGWSGAPQPLWPRGTLGRDRKPLGLGSLLRALVGQPGFPGHFRPQLPESPDFLPDPGSPSGPVRHVPPLPRSLGAWAGVGWRGELASPEGGWPSD